MVEHDFYRLMELEPYAGIDEVKKRYRELAKLYHPDKNPRNRHAEEYFKVLTQGYNILSEPDEKENYDRLLRNYYETRELKKSPEKRREDEVREKVVRHRERRRREFIDAYVRDENTFPHRYRYILSLMVFISGLLMCYNHWYINYLNFKVFYIVIGAFLFGLGSYMISENLYKRKSFRKAMRIEEYGEDAGPVKTFVLLFLLTPVLFVGLMKTTRTIHLKYYYDVTVVTKALRMQDEVTFQYSVEGEEISRRADALPGEDYTRLSRLRVKYSRLNPYISELIVLDNDQP